MKRLFAPIFVLLMLLLPSTALADYGFSMKDGIKTQNSCGTADSKFVLHVYYHVDYSPTHNHLIICSEVDNLCDVSIEGLPYVNCITGSWNDNISSWKFTQRDSGWCARMYQNANQGGATWTSASNVANPGSSWNDQISSVRPVPC